jgi:hypothetical protein
MARVATIGIRKLSVFPEPVPVAITNSLRSAPRNASSASAWCWYGMGYRPLLSGTEAISVNTVFAFSGMARLSYGFPNA